MTKQRTYHRLTGREKSTILNATAMGISQTAIARELGLVQSTVGGYLRRIEEGREVVPVVVEQQPRAPLPPRYPLLEEIRERAVLMQRHRDAISLIREAYTMTGYKSLTQVVEGMEEFNNMNPLEEEYLAYSQANQPKKTNGEAEA